MKAADEPLRVPILCPACGRGKLAAPAAAHLEYVCPQCSAKYPVDGGVIDLLPGTAQRPNFAQRSMQFDPLIRIYESRLWRRSSVAKIIMGIGFEDEYALIADAAVLGKTEFLLDLACGPGIYARRFARKIGAGAVVGLDLSMPMLHYASRMVREEGIGNLMLLHGNAMALPFEPGQFEVVNCCGALHLFPDIGRVIGEVGRVLKPGGRFTIATSRRADGWIAQQWFKFISSIGVEAFTFSQLESILAQAGFTSKCLHAAAGWMVIAATRNG
jgi:ubiquinone/menaquinone biosynthesis C-methylase UbiE